MAGEQVICKTCKKAVWDTIFGECVVCYHAHYADEGTPQDVPGTVELTEHAHDFLVRVREYELVRWCTGCGLTHVAYRHSPTGRPFSTWRQVKDEETAEFLINQA